ncbi:hypothetical protein AB0I51_39340 [Streptomyces sp. NPDC050549]|uniref:hypothetical protein n=1 Tax=Streptomyces sp. NPDC050549 TaxID=3155406 RepID=UPI00343286F6
MTDDLSGTEKPLASHRQVAADLGREIAEGSYGSGGRLPAEGELADGTASSGERSVRRCSSCAPRACSPRGTAPAGS